VEPVERRGDDDQRARVETALDTAANEAAKRAVYKTASRAAGGYFLLLLFLLIGAVLYQRATNERLDTASRRLDSSEMRACERLQSQRERTNVSEARQYLLLHAVTLSPTASRQVKDRFETLAGTTLYDPPTDCHAAVSAPSSYAHPPSIPFHALPLKYAQSVVTAAKQKRPQPTP
jgi:hypothetical protein